MAAYPFSAATSYDDDGYSEHEEHEFCYDMTCPCHEDSINVNRLNEHVEDGTASTTDANNIYRGRTV